MDGAPRSEIADLIDEVASTAQFEEEIAGALGRSGRPDPRIPALVDAFRYIESHDSGSQHFGPLATFIDGRLLPGPLADAPQDQLDAWATLAAEVNEPMARARLHDLLFETRHGHTGDHARQAAEGYLLLADRPTEFEVDAKLIRALDLARKVGDDHLALAAIARIEQEVPGAIHRESHGAVARLLDALSADRATPATFDDLVVQALAAEPGPDCAEDLLRLQLRRATPGLRPPLERAIVDIWAVAASRHEGPVRVHHLDRAISLARDLGHSDLVSSLTAEMQQTTLADHKFERFGVRAHLPRELEENIDAYFGQARSWGEAAELIRRAGPPSGSVDKNRAEAEASVHTSVTSTVASSRVGGDGLLRWTPTTPEDMAESRLAERETRAMQMNAGRMIRVLRRFHERLGPLRAECFADVEEAQPHITPPERDAIGRAFDHFAAGDFEASAAIAVPRIEAALRGLLLSTNHPLYRIQRANSPGQYPGLGTLISVGETLGLDESWLRFLSTFLTGGSGANFRNELAHGFIAESGPMEAAFTLVGLLWLMSISVAITDSGPTDGGSVGGDDAADLDEEERTAGPSAEPSAPDSSV